MNRLVSACIRTAPNKLQNKTEIKRRVIRPFVIQFICVMSTVQIDGSLGEGGGQVLRVALCLSALYKIPVEINNIRAGRPKPGLAAQHLKGVELLKSMCNADVKGAHVGSTLIKFVPGRPSMDKNQKFIVDIGTAGCICLLVQVALPCAIFFSHRDMVTLILKGGTNVPMGPQIEYLTEVLKPLLNKFGADFDFSVVTRGYYPKGGGEVHLRIKTVESLNAVTLDDPGLPSNIFGWSYVAGNVHIKEGHKMASDVKRVLTEGLTKHNIRVPPINIECYKEDTSMAIGNGSGINIVCETSSGCILGGSGLGSGRQGHPAPGVTAATEILDAIVSASCVDAHAQDQLIIFMALATGTSKIKIGSNKLTLHTKTAIEIAEMMLKNRNLQFKLHNEKTDLAILECTGCGYKNEMWSA